MSVQAAPAAPFAATQAPTGIRATSAVLNGMATPNGLPSAAWFEWGTNGVFGQVTPATDVGEGTGVVHVSAGISNLTARQIYWCRLVVSNSLGVVQGREQRFITGGKIIGWGWDWEGQLKVPTGFTNAVAVGGGQMHSLAMLDDGTLGVWGAEVWGAGCREALAVPADLDPVQAIAVGGGGNVALLQDGTVRGWGCDAWIWVDGPAGLSNVVAIAGGDRHGLALHADGTVAAWGEGPFGATSVPVGLSNVVAIGAGAHHSLALRNDGTVVGWGANWAGQTNVPVDLGNVVSIAAGEYHNLAVRNDGTVVAWGDNGSYQTEVPTGLSNVVGIAAGAAHSLALRADGRVVGWGHNMFGAADASESASNVVAIAAGQNHSLALGCLNAAPITKPRVVASESRGDLIIALEATDPNGDLLRLRITSLPAVGVLYQCDNGGRGPIIASADVEVTDGHGRVVFVPEPDGYDDPYAGFDFVANDGEADSSAARITVRLLEQPFATTLAAGVVDGRTWMLNGLATPNGFPTTAWFEWGAINRYGRATTPVGIGSGRGVIHVRAGITNLTAGRVYHFCLVTSNEVGVTRGADQRFTVGDQVVAWGANGFGQTNVPAGLADVVALAGGFYHSLAARSSGTAVAWGNNEEGQATVPPDLTGVVAVTGGGLHSLALRNDGTVVGFGYDGYGQSSPPAGLSNAVAIAAGNSHNLAIRSDGTVVAWGLNGSYQTEVPAGLSNVVAVTAGRDHSLALRDDGSVVAWGTNWSGQLDVPAALSDVVAIAAGDSHNLALRSDRTVVAWGNNYSGQTNVPATLSGVVAIAAGDQHSLALRDDGTVVVWGRIWDGQTYVPATVPTGLSNVVTVAAGALHNLALCVDTWSVNSAPQASAQWATGAAGQDLTLTLSASDPDGDPIGFRVTSLPQRGTLYQYADGTRGSAILAPDTGVSDPMGRIMFVPEPEGYGDPYASFGFVASDGALDSPLAMVTIRVVRAPFSATQAPTEIRETSAALNGMATPNGLPSVAWFEWGMNGAFDQVTPALEVGTGMGVVRISAGVSNLMARQTYRCRLVVSNALGSVPGAHQVFVTGGRVLVWGSNLYGETNVPPDLDDAVAIAGRGSTPLALRTDGTVLAWGFSEQGETNVPSGLTNVVAIQHGQYTSVVLRHDGTVAAWGNDPYGQAVVPAGLRDVVAIAAGGYHALALRSDGTVQAWGFDDFQQTDVPAGLSNVVAIAGGGNHSLALRNDGTVVAWGYNVYGQSQVPVGLTEVVGIAGGDNHSLALRKNGTVVAWGAGSNPSETGGWPHEGQSVVPADLQDVVAITGDWLHSVAFRRDGTVVAWGFNHLGQVSVPAGLTNAVAVAAGTGHSMALLDADPSVTPRHPPDADGASFLQTGLMWQRVRVANPSPWISPAVRVLIQGLPPGTVVFNASGTNDLGQPYVQYNQPLAPGASIDLIIEYFAPNRMVPDVVLVAESAPATDPPEIAGTVQPVTRSLALDDGSYLIDFRTLADRTYHVQYSADLSTWRTAFPSVVGSGSGMQWVDNGPPKTDRHPSTQTNRFYRVLLAP